MVNKKLLWGMLVLTLVFGLSVVSCEEEEDPVKTPQHTIKITGINDKTGTAMIAIFSKMDYIEDAKDNTDLMPEVWGTGTIKNKSVTVSLFTNSFLPYTGSGNFYIAMMISSNDSDSSTYIYTNGKQLSEITSDTGMNLPKYNITGSSSTIAFTKFIEVDLGDEGDDD